MALATKCPHCNTIFRVAADQLKLRGGIVRCGSCHQVFDGNAALVEPAAKPTPVIPDIAAELAAPAAAIPAISDYVHGSPVDFEIDFAEDAAPAAAEKPPAAAASIPAAPAPAAPAAAPAPAASTAATSAPAAPLPPAAAPVEAPAPAVWRTAVAPTPTPTPAPAAQPVAEPSPEETAKAAVARAFATVNTPASRQSLSALVAPDDAFSAAAGETSALVPDAPPASATDDVVAPAAQPSTTIDDKLLTWEDIPANESAASDAAAMAAVARAFNHVAARAEEENAPAPQAAPMAEAPAPDATEPEPESVEPPLAAAAPWDADVLPAGDIAAPDAPEPAPQESAPMESALEESLQDEPPSEESPQDAPLLESTPEEPALQDQLPEAAVLQASEPEEPALAEAEKVESPLEAASLEESPAEEPAPAIEPEPEHSAPAGAALLEAIDQWSADNSRPDGRIEPSLDTPQEHIVLAAIDDAHHFEDLPSAAEAEAGLPQADEPWSLSEPEPAPDSTALHAVAAVNTDAPDDGESLPSDEEQAAAEAALAAARMRALAGVDEPDDLDHSALSFVKRVDRSQKYGKAATIAMAIGIPLLLAGLVLQAATTFRDTLAANYPQLKPALAAVCQPLGCKIALPTQLDALSIEPGELAAMAANTFSFSTVLRNQSKTAQAWPHIELTLNDNADKPVLRRVFAPREYLPSAAEAEKGFGPRSEQSIKLYFELKELKASGYHIAIFYP